MFMKKSEIKKTIKSASETKELCRILFRYDSEYSFYFPIASSDRLFLSANDDDFIIDGFSIRRFCDIEKVKIENNKYAEIIKSEGVLNNIRTPELDITDWNSAFLSLSRLNTNIIIEKESPDKAECEFAIGKIIKVLKSKVIFKHFESNGIWQDECCEIPYSQITSVTFGCRYVETFSKYI